LYVVTATRRSYPISHHRAKKARRDYAIRRDPLVEDNPADVRLTEEALLEGWNPAAEQGPLHVSVVPDGVEALDFLRRAGRYAAAPQPDLVLLDLNLPRKNGREVLAEVKSDPELRRIPVIMLTTSHAESDVRSAYDLHANCYLTKSPDLEQFFDVIEQVERFWLGLVRLPAHAGSSPTVSAAASASPEQATVLVVDDDPNIVDMLELALTEQGYHVLSALGAEALRLAHDRRPDLVLLDMNMPVLDGAAISRGLRDDPVTRDIPIVVMSAQASQRARSALLPGVDWLPKPFDLDLLYTTVARWTHGAVA